MKTLSQQVRHTPVIDYRLPRCQTTTALLNGHPIAVDQEHRRWSAADYIPGAPETPGQYEPVVLTVSAPISLSLEDIIALLFDWPGLSYEDLADDHLVRALVADTVVNGGCSHLEELRCRLGEHTSLTQDAATWLAYCRQRATTLFTTPSHPAGVPQNASLVVR